MEDFFFQRTLCLKHNIHFTCIPPDSLPVKLSFRSIDLNGSFYISTCPCLDKTVTGSETKVEEAVTHSHYALKRKSWNCVLYTHTHTCMRASTHVRAHIKAHNLHKWHVGGAQKPIWSATMCDVLAAATTAQAAAAAVESRASHSHSKEIALFSFHPFPSIFSWTGDRDCTLLCIKLFFLLLYILTCTNLQTLCYNA